jgi:predicted acetylornithine/succinylornithine family transaminase
MSGADGPAAAVEDSQVWDMDRGYVLPTYARQPLEVVAGRGSEVQGADGRWYLDFVMGISVNNFGHCHPHVVKAVRDQVGRLVSCSNLYLTAPQARLAARLSVHAEGGKVFFCNSGAEANEAAIKIARKRAQSRGQERIIALQEAFHGRTMATLSATGQPGKQKPFAPLLPGFTHVPANDVEVLRAAFASGGVAAFMAEPVQGEAGAKIVAPEYLQEAERLCRSADALLILDEVQTGMGRCGSPFAYQRYGLDPDVVTLAKSLAGGLPMGALIARNEAEGVLEAGDHGSTFGGGPVVAAAALAMLDLLEQPGLFEEVEERGQRLEGWLLKLVEAGAAKEVRRLGLLAGVDVVQPVAKEVVAAGLTKGILLNATSDVTLRFLPPLTVAESDIDRVGLFLQDELVERCGKR